MPDKRALRKILIEGILWQSRVKTQCFHCQGLSLIPGQRTKIAPATWHAWSKKKKKERERQREKLNSWREPMMKLWQSYHTKWNATTCFCFSSLVYLGDKKNWDGRQAKESSSEEIKDELTKHKQENKHAVSSVHIASYEDRYPGENLQVLTNPCSHSLSLIIDVFINLSQRTHLTALQLQLKPSGWGCFMSLWS